MKIKVSKRELYETIENSVRKALNESVQAPNGKKMHKPGNKKEKYPNKWEDDEDTIKEWVDDDDDDDAVSRFLKDKKNQLPKRMKGGGAARKAAMADIKAELDAEKKDNDSLERAEKADRAQED